ncbi:MAG: cell division protein FtsZ, partial [Alphaproteobacteria bacterium]|nr:cell division protein FtsZ [Alphaproteobacteria bacterium]
MSINLSVPAGATIPELKPKLTVIGVGGAGGNAVNNMIHRELEGVEFVVANTDAQALEQSQAEARIQLGANLTQGLGAGSQPDVGRAAAEEAIEEVLASLSGSHMAFIAAGMGGGTGTGAAPAIARAAKEAGILTVAVVTKPFQFEGAHRMRLAEAGVEELEQYVDTLIIIPNQNLFRVATENTTFADAFAMADEVLYSGVRGVTDLMVMPGLINLDFADIRSVMSEMGKAMMGTGEAEGERRALDAAEAAIANPLLDDTSMKGAKGVLINITGGSDITLFEVDEAASRIRAEVDQDAYIIIGSAFDNDLQGKMRVSVVATGIDAVAGVMPQPTMLRVTDAVAPQRSLPVASPAAEDKPKETLSIVAAEIEIADEASSPEPEMQEPHSPLARLVREAQTNKGSQSEAPEMADVEPEQVVAEPPAEEEVSPFVEVTTDKPKLGNALTIEPPAAMPRAEADDAFIPPQPVAPASEEPAGEAGSVATDALMGDQAT